jgi:hypothetical protein
MITLNFLFKVLSFYLRTKAALILAKIRCLIQLLNEAKALYKIFKLGEVFFDYPSNTSGLDITAVEYKTCNLI